MEVAVVIMGCFIFILVCSHMLQATDRVDLKRQIGVLKDRVDVLSGRFDVHTHEPIRRHHYGN